MTARGARTAQVDAADSDGPEAARLRELIE